MIKTTPFEMVFIIRDEMKPLKEKISITIDYDILEKARNEAEKDDRSLSQYINLILKQHITKIEQENKP